MAFNEAKEILSSFTSKIPEYLNGPDRMTYLLENMEQLSGEDRMMLKNTFNRFLTNMIEKEASDIEVGGHGNENFIWMRVYGKKERVKDLPQLTNEEAALLITNLLNTNQRKYLAVSKNLDFSYTYFYDRRKVDLRFRADAYFDLDTISLNMRAINPSIRPLSSLGFHPNVVKSLSHM